MELTSSITDPFDWPITMPELRTIDNLLRCGICCEFFNIAMILPKCSHNYCSQCIRRYMNYKTQCPACNTPAVEGEIRNNKVLDEIVKNFIQVRPHVLKLCKGQSQRSETGSEKVTPARTRKDARKTPKSSETVLTPGTAFAVQETSKFFTTETPKRPHKSEPDTPLNRSNEENINPSSTNEDEDVVILDDDPPQDTSSPSSSKSPPSNVPATRSDKSSCPVCSVPVAIKHINTHLDLCLRRGSEKPAKRRTEKRKPLPKLVYNIMSDKELRRKLKEYKLSSQGSRKELIRRIQEYTVLYNAQCDSDDPTPVEDVIKYYERMERIRTKPLQKSSSQSFKLKVEKGQTEAEILNSQKEYLRHHNKQFEDLLKNAKKSMKKRMTSPATPERSATSSSETESESKTNTVVTGSESNSEDPVGQINLAKEGNSSDSIQKGSEMQESALNLENITDASVAKTMTESVPALEAKSTTENVRAHEVKSISESVHAHEAKSMTENVSANCLPVDPEKKLQKMDTENSEASFVSKETEMTGNEGGKGSMKSHEMTRNKDGEDSSGRELERNIFQENVLPAERNEFLENQVEKEGSSIASEGRNFKSESQVINHVTGQTYQVPFEVMDQTSPVFGKDFSVTSVVRSVDHDQDSSSQEQQDVATGSDKKMARNKLRRKRKTVLEQLEADLSNKTEEWTKRASKRNKKS
ncbi:E3 ubiquitin-protein ligase RAD18 [Holothuria leucospilota]|uniref:RING-type E3 ubiquitin transferase n=1 Tax=Holothuria leucospilota TaxID=206669 RepID=A0A9Q1CK56_HOLLE|nr:E3 ubiquitin-protein ligase RAD18 [Holothuria leucospilota]